MAAGCRASRTSHDRGPGQAAPCVARVTPGLVRDAESQPASGKVQRRRRPRLLSSFQRVLTAVQRQPQPRRTPKQPKGQVQSGIWGLAFAAAQTVPSPSASSLLGRRPAPQAHRAGTPASPGRSRGQEVTAAAPQAQGALPGHKAKAQNGQGCKHHLHWVSGRPVPTHLYQFTVGSRGTSLAPRPKDSHLCPSRAGRAGFIPIPATSQKLSQLF